MTSSLRYSNRFCTDTAKDNLQTIGTERELSLLILGIEMDMDVGTGGRDTGGKCHHFYKTQARCPFSCSLVTLLENFEDAKISRNVHFLPVSDLCFKISR